MSDKQPPAGASSPDDMSPIEGTPTPAATASGFTLSRRATWIIAAAGVAAVVAIASLAIAVGSGSAPGAGSTSSAHSPSPSPSPSKSGSTAPSTSPTPTPGESSAPAPADPSTPIEVDIDEPADIVPGLTASIGSIEAVQGEAERPGEIAGPSIRFVVSIANGKSTTANLANTVVTAYYGSDLTPALELGEPGGSPLPAEVGAGQTVTGTYIFSIPTEERSQVRIMVDYSVEVSPLVFEGPVPQ